MNKPFSEINKNFGFGCMRLPMKDEKVDYEEFSKMIDTFIENGFNYFDTAHGYLDGKSEIAIRECLSKRYDRSKYLLANKLSDGFFKTEADIRPFFEQQLKWCGVEYFDFYLMHAITAKNYEQYKSTNAYEVARKLKKEGKIKHLGMSFHDKAEFLDKILSEQSAVEFVQLQFNYADYDDPSVESFKCYEVCKKYNKPVIVMEPVKGGTLVNLPDKAKKVLDSLGENYSHASYAIRFAASFENIFMVLSGMGSCDMMNDNVSYMKDFVPLCEKEMKALEEVRGIFKGLDTIPCTACRYCVAGCPKGILIPDLFACYNAKKQFGDWNSDYYYGVHTKTAKASDCIECGKCEFSCPQNLEIRKLLKSVAKEFEK